MCDALRGRLCRWCDDIFYICRCCDRGHAYCGDDCRKRGYARTRRAARDTLAQSDEGKAANRDRQRKHREAERDRVTDQTSRPAVPSGNVAGVAAMVPPPAGRPEGTRDETAGERKRLSRPVRCVVCGRASRWVCWWPPGYFPGPRRC